MEKQHKHLDVIRPLGRHSYWSRLPSFVICAAIAFLGFAGVAFSDTITLTGPSEIKAGQTAEYRCVLTSATGTKNVSATWMLYDLTTGNSSGPYTGSKCTLTGLDVKIDHTMYLEATYLGVTVSMIVINKAPKPKSLVIIGPEEIGVGEEAVYYCEAKWPDGTTTVVEADLTVTGPDGLEGAFSTYVYYINANPPTQDTTYTIEASYSGVVTRKNVVIEGRKITWLTISGPSVVASSGTAQYVCEALFSDGTTELVAPEWTITEGEDYGTIGFDGMFWAVSTEVTRLVGIHATYGGKEATKSVTIEAKTIVSMYIVGPDTLQSLETGTYQAYAQYDDGTEGPMQATWTVSGTDYSDGPFGPAEGVIVRAPSVRQTTSFTIQAVSDDGHSATMAVTVLAKQVQALQIVGPNTIPSLGQAQYRCLREYDDGTSDDATEEASWSVPVGSAYAGFSSKGLLQAVSTEQNRDVTIKASVDGKEATKGVTIIAKTIVSLEIVGPDSLEAGGSASYTCVAIYSDETTKMVSPEWGLSSPVAGDSISSGGLLRTQRTELGRTVIVMANYQGTSAYKEVAVIGSKNPHDPDSPDEAEDPWGTLLSFFIRPDDSKIAAFGSTQIRAFARYRDATGKERLYEVTDETTFHFTLSRYSEYADLYEASGWLVGHNFKDHDVVVSIKGYYTSSGKDSKTMAATTRVRIFGLPSPYNPPTPTPTPSPGGDPGDDPEVKPVKLVITGPSSVPSKGTGTYLALATYPDGSVSVVTPSWSIAHGNGDTIGANNGILQAAAAIYDRQIEIRAQFGDLSASKSVTICGRTVSSISIEGASSVTSGSSVTYTCVAHYDDGTSDVVSPEWSIVKGWDYGWISRFGLFVAGNVTSHGTVEIGAAFNGKTAKKVVLINPSTVETGEEPGVETPVELYVSGASSLSAGSVASYTCTAVYADGTTREVSPSWSVISKDSHSTIDADGLFTADKADVGRDISIRALWEGITADFTIHVVEDVAHRLVTIIINGANTVEAGSVTTFSCLAVWDDGLTTEVSPKWSLVSGEALGSLSTNGVFTAASSTSGGEVQIKAEWSGLTTIWSFWVNFGGEPVSMSILGPDAVAAEGSAEYLCKAIWADGLFNYVEPTWSIASGASHGSISSNGIFTANATAAPRKVVISAYYGHKRATKSIDILVGNWFVDAVTGNDANDGRSWISAKKTIQAAIDESSEGDLILVNDGCYEPISSGNKAITISSVNGAENTIIDASLQWSRGVTNRCATLGSESAHTNTVLRGFRLTKGIAFNGGGSCYGTLENCTLKGNEASNYGGGSYYGILNDCSLSGNTAYWGGGSYYGTLENCTLSENLAVNGGGSFNGTLTKCELRGNKVSNRGGGTDSGTLRNCILSGNAATWGGGSCDATLINCVLTGNVAENRLILPTLDNEIIAPRIDEPWTTSIQNAPVAFDSPLDDLEIGDNRGSGGGAFIGELINCIVWGNSALSSNAVYNSSCRHSCFDEEVGGEGNIYADPCFVNASAGDYRLRAESPCIDAGDNGSVTWTLDMDGSARIQNDQVDMGAYEHRSPWRVTFDVRGNLSQTGPIATVAPENGRYYVLPESAPVRDGCLFLGWTLSDGSPVDSLSSLPPDTQSVILYANWAAVYTIRFIAAAKSFIDEHPEEEFSGEMDDIVCVSGDPVTLPACAFTRKGYACMGWLDSCEGVRYLNGETVPSFTSIPGAVITLSADWRDTSTTTFADPVGGHVVGAGARVYSSLQAAINAAPDGGTVFAFPGTYGPISAKGRKGLCIYSAFAPSVARNESDLSVIDGNGSSPCAVFDVATGDGNVMLSGFHLTRGCGDYGGGAVGGILYNCLITDCEADEDGGGACDSILENCCVSSCRAYASGGGAAFCDMYSTIIDGCSAAYYGGGAAICYIYGSTIYGNSAEAGAGVAGSTVYNSIVWENRLYEKDKKGVRKLGNYANIMDGKKTLYKNTFTYTDSSPKPAGKGNLAKDPLFVDAALGDFRLQTASPVKNKGSSAYLNEWNWDIRQLPRILGAAPDMGAHESPEGTMVPADYDGDGVADAAYFDEATANWVVMRSRDGLMSVNFGSPKDIPLAAYFDGDHRADMAVYSATAKAPAFSVLTRSWYLFGP